MHLFCPKSIAIFISFLITTSINAQNDNPNLKISLKLENFSEGNIYLEFEDISGCSIIDTFNKLNNGLFTISANLEKPSFLSIYSTYKFMYSFYTAPGSDLIIKSDVSSFESQRSSTSITGNGSECMDFDIKLSELYRSSNLTITQYDTNLVQFISGLKWSLVQQDSLLLSVFNSSANKSPYLNSLLNLKRVDSYFGALNFFQNLARNTNLPFAKSDSILRHDFDFNHDMLVDSNLQSNEFKTFLTRYYVYHIVNFDLERSNDKTVDRFNTVNKIISTFTGHIKEYLLSDYFVRNISNASTYADYESYVSRYNISKYHISNIYLSDAIENAIMHKKSEFTASDIGNPAPNFTVVDSAGNTFDILHFKGKVVYIDLWASWCLPCREETPHLEKIYNNFKSNPDLAILGIAVFDRPTQWRKAIEHDNPKWLQLFDNKESVTSFFTGTLEIPRFILINKLGNIVSFNAPLPHEKDEIINLIAKELEK